jgi:hypothetical protein
MENNGNNTAILPYLLIFDKFLTNLRLIILLFLGKIRIRRLYRNNYTDWRNVELGAGSRSIAEKVFSCEI